MVSGGSPDGTPPPPLTPSVHRESRWRGQGYADITKLREIAAKHDRNASKHKRRAARIYTHIEKLRHRASLLREKSQKVLEKIPDLEADAAAYERDIHTIQKSSPGAHIGSDATDLQFKVRKIQQKIVDCQHKSRTLELKAAHLTQKTAELKVKADQSLEKAQLEEAEAAKYRERADRLQASTEADLASPPSGHPPSAPSHDSGGPA
jgi:peptidoglycan hydrolase CwlO-like protein